MAFDPYHKWLAILPKDQPPNHYRLLGLEVFESDLDVIEGAADRAMGYIRQYQAGEHASLAAKLLNEIAAARLCLLKPKSKADYDAKLKQELAGRELQPMTKVDSSFELDTSLMDLELPSRRRQTAKKQKKRSNSSVLVAGGVGAGIVVVVLMAAFFLNSAGKPAANNLSIQEESAKSNSTQGSPIASQTDSVLKPDSATKTELTSKHDPVSKPRPVVESILAAESAGPDVDLIQPIDFSRDAVEGHWEKAGTTLVGSTSAKLYLPVTLPDDYRLRFVVKRLEGNDAIGFGFVNEGRLGTVAIDGYYSTVSGLWIDGTDYKNNCTTHLGPVLVNGRSSSVDVSVHPGHIKVEVDGQPIVNWYGKPERLDCTSIIRMVNREIPLVWIPEARFQIESAVMTPLKPEPIVAPIARLDREIDLLPLINLERDKVRGNWEMTEQVLSCMGNGRIYLPVDVPEEYTLSATVERALQLHEHNEVAFGLVSGKSSFQIASKSGAAGLDMIDGKRWHDNEARFEGEILKPGIPARFDCTVTKTGIRTEVDGKTVIDWRGDIRRLGIPGDWAVADGRRLYLGTIHPFKFREIKIGPPRPAPKLPEHPPLSVGISIDLLAFVDPKCDVLSGTWMREGRHIRAMADVLRSKLIIPFDLPQEYKLSIRIAREPGGPTNDEALLITVPIADSKATITIDGHRKTMTAIPVDDNNYVNSSITFRGPLILDGPSQEFECVVKATGIQFSKQGKTIFEWKGNPRRFLTLPEFESPGPKICLTSWNSRFRFEKLELQPLEVSTFAPVKALGGDGNLLTIIDPQRDSRKGDWKLAAGGLACPAIPAARLRIPTSVPKQYELAATVERKSGINELFLGLVIAGHSCTAGIDGGNSNLAGLMHLDGCTFYTAANPTNRVYAGPLLPNDRPVKIRCYVLSDTIIVICGDKEVLRWHGDPRRLTPGNDYLPPNYSSDDRDHLWLGGWKSEFIIRELTLKPIHDDEAAGIAADFSGVFPTSYQTNVPLTKVIPGEEPITPTDGGVYLFVSSNSGRCLSVKEGGAVQGPFAERAGPSERWKAIVAGDCFKLVNAKSGKVLAVSGSDKNQGAPIIEFKDLKSDDQKWQFVKVGEFFSIKSRLSGHVVSVADGAKDENHRILQWGDAQAPEQLWRVERVSNGTKK